MTYVEIAPGVSSWRCWLLGHRMVGGNSGRLVQTDGLWAIKRYRTCDRCWRVDELLPPPSGPRSLRGPA